MYLPPQKTAGTALVSHRKEWILFFVWAALNLFFLIHRGIFDKLESDKYIGEAHRFVETGHLSSSNFWLYFVQIGLLALCIKLKISFVLVYLIQLLFNLLSCYLFYKTLNYLFRNTQAAFAGTLLLLFNYPYQEYNTFLQTESLFYSFTVIASCYLIHIEELTLKKLLTTTMLLAIICVTRPTGLLFLPPAFIYLFFIFFRTMSAVKKTALLALIGAGFFFLLNKALGSGGELDFMLPFRDERIICGVPTLSGFLPIHTTGNGNSIYGLLYYILHNFSQFARLAGLRALAFFGLYRSYYSIGHNTYLIVYFYSIHLMALAGVTWWIKKNISKFYYFSSVILLTLLTVILTCDDWHNRFYLNISPFLIILGMPSLLKLLKHPMNDR